jgi:hypothetical protein
MPLLVVRMPLLLAQMHQLCQPMSMRMLQIVRHFILDSGAQPPTDNSSEHGNRLLDGNVGMTTGWLGGLLRTNVTNPLNGFDSLGDLSQTKLLKLMWAFTLETGGDRDPNSTGIQPVGPLRTDGLLYSANSLFSVARFYQNQRTTDTLGPLSNTQARWIHHGSLLSFELGFLLTGNAEKTTSSFTVSRATPMALHQPQVPTSGTEVLRWVYSGMNA